jgi:hypothetical protein
MSVALITSCVIALIFTSKASATDVAVPPSQSELSKTTKVVELGNQKYQVGNVIVDKANKSFTLSGSVIRREAPLEFLAVTKGGFKAYESLLELDSDAYEFNLACILIGLDAKNVKGAEMHFDPKPIHGDEIEISVSWNEKGKKKSISAAQLLTVEKKQINNDTWIYTGSAFSPNNVFMAAHDGTLIGFVHDPASIIEHKIGLGIGDYGAVAASKVTPKVGTKIEIEIKNVN